MDAPAALEFRRALWEGNADEARRLLQIDSSLVNKPALDINGEKVHPLFLAVAGHPRPATNALKRVELVRVLLDHNADVKAIDKWGNNALHRAVLNNMVQESLEVVEFLLQYQEDVDVRGHLGFTPLMRVKSVEMASLLIANGADVKSRNNAGNTPLVFARSPETARLLIAHGADANSKNNRGLPVWISAIIGPNGCDSETFKVLIQHVTDQHLRATWGADCLSGLHLVNECYGNLQILEYLLNQGVDVNARTAEGETPLHYAVGHSYRHNQVQRVQLLLQHGADVNATDNEGRTALASLPCDGYEEFTEVAKLLIDHGADVSRDGSRILLESLGQRGPNLSMAKLILEQEKIDLNTSDSADSDTLAFVVLGLAVLNQGRAKDKYGPILMLLIKHGADVHGRDRKSGRTPLHYAIDVQGDNNDEDYDCDFAPVVKMLLEKGSDIDAADNEGRTPVLVASSKGKWKMVELLVNYGANVNIASVEKDTATPLMMACEVNEVRVVQLLLNAGAQVNVRDKGGIAALLICVKNHFVECGTLLLERGGDIHVGNRKGCTPFLLACKDGKLDMIYYLIRLSPHDRRLGLLSQASYPFASTPTMISMFVMIVSRILMTVMAVTQVAMLMLRVTTLTRITRAIASVFLTVMMQMAMMIPRQATIRKTDNVHDPFVDSDPISG